jgi:hypothetical protein
MAGGFEPIDPERCAHYAGFASHLDRRSFDFIYWLLFALVIGMLFLASWKYSGLVHLSLFSIPYPFSSTDTTSFCVLGISTRSAPKAWSPEPPGTGTS